jgi:hypothetical protein
MLTVSRARAKETARKATGGKAPRKELEGMAARRRYIQGQLSFTTTRSTSNMSEDFPLADPLSPASARQNDSLTAPALRDSTGLQPLLLYHKWSVVVRSNLTSRSKVYESPGGRLFYSQKHASEFIRLMEEKQCTEDEAFDIFAQDRNSNLKISDIVVGGRRGSTVPKVSHKQRTPEEDKLFGFKVVADKRLKQGKVEYLVKMDDDDKGEWHSARMVKDHDSVAVEEFERNRVFEETPAILAFPQYQGEINKTKNKAILALMKADKRVSMYHFIRTSVLSISVYNSRTM